MRILTKLLILLQIMDGALTGFAATVSSYGTAVEGNPLIKALMNNLGVIPGLLMVKGGAILVLLLMERLKVSKYWMFIVFIIYFLVVVEWLVVIFSGRMG